MRLILICLSFVVIVILNFVWIAYLWSIIRKIPFPIMTYCLLSFPFKSRGSSWSSLISQIIASLYCSRSGSWSILLISLILRHKLLLFDWSFICFLGIVSSNWLIIFWSLSYSLLLRKTNIIFFLYSLF
jgi:hypothetical protein